MGGLMELEEKISKELAKKYGYLPGQAKQLVGFVKVIHNFSHYLGSNKYYSDALNKRIAFLSVDCDILSLKVERMRLLAESFYSQMELAILTKEKAVLDKASVAEFKRQMRELESEALAVHDRALKLMQDIKAEYAQRGPDG